MESHAKIENNLKQYSNYLNSSSSDKSSQIEPSNEKSNKKSKKKK
jgi:hypothetical protein